MANSTKPRQWFNIAPRAEADGDEGSSADVYIYAEIGESWWGNSVSAHDFAQLIAELDVDKLRVFINSPGGAAWDGISIMNALRRHRAHVEVTVDGIAASAASVIAMAGDHIIMNRGAEMMIHRASGFAYGNAETMTETAEILVKLDDSIADIYQARAGRTREHWRTQMDAESWYTAEEAVTAGLADEWADAPAANAAFDMSRFKFAARAQAPAPRLEAIQPPSSPEPVEPKQEEEDAVSDNLKPGLLERLGITDAAASDDAILAAVDGLVEQATTPAPVANAVPDGTQLIDSEALATLQADAAAGREARAEQIRNRREGIVNRAVEEGRISPANRETWLTQLEANEEGATALLNTLAVNTVPVTEIGHADDINAEDSLARAAGWDDDEKGA